MYACFYYIHGDFPYVRLPKGTLGKVALVKQWTLEDLTSDRSNGRARYLFLGAVRCCTFQACGVSSVLKNIEDP